MMHWKPIIPPMETQLCLQQQNHCKDRLSPFYGERGCQIIYKQCFYRRLPLVSRGADLVMRPNDPEQGGDSGWSIGREVNGGPYKSELGAGMVRRGPAVHIPQTRCRSGRRGRSLPPGPAGRGGSAGTWCTSAAPGLLVPGWKSSSWRRTKHMDLPSGGKGKSGGNIYIENILLFIHQSIFVSTHLSIHPSIHISKHQSTKALSHKSTYLPT